jgi:hypothetical protein
MVSTVPGVTTINVSWSPIEKYETAGWTPPMTGSIQNAPLSFPGEFCLIAQPETKVPGVTTLRQKEGAAAGDADGDALFIDDVALESLIVGEREANVIVSDVVELDTTTVAEELDEDSVADEVGVKELKS